MGRASSTQPAGSSSRNNRPVSQGVLKWLEPFQQRSESAMDGKVPAEKQKLGAPNLGAPGLSSNAGERRGSPNTLLPAVASSPKSNQNQRTGARSVSPSRKHNTGPQSEVYEYLFGWEEYLRRTKERQASIVIKKLPEGAMPFKSGRSRQRPQRFMKPNIPEHELGWRQLLGNSGNQSIEGIKDLMQQLAHSREIKQQANGGAAPESYVNGLGAMWEQAGPARISRQASNLRAESPMDMESRFSFTRQERVRPWDPDLLKKKEVRLFELSQTQENLVRLPRPIQRIGLGTPIEIPKSMFGVNRPL